MIHSLSIYNLLSIIVGLILVIVGILTYFRASKLRPNTYFGFRVPLAFLSNNVWRVINKLAGFVSSVIGFALIFLGLLIGGIIPLLGTFIGIFLDISIPIIFTKSKIQFLTDIEPGPSEPVRILEVIKINKMIYVLSILCIVAVFVYTFIYFNKLPEKLAVHFDISGRPDFYMNKTDFVIAFLTYVVSFASIFISILYAIDGVPNIPEFKEYNDRLKTIFTILPFLFAIINLGVIWFIFSYNLSI